MPGAKPSRNTIVLYVVLAALFAIALAHKIRDTADRFDEVVRGDVLARLPFDGDFTEMVVTELTPEAEAAGLRRQDRVIRIQGQPRTLAVLIGAVMSASPGDTLTVDVESPTAAGPE